MRTLIDILKIAGYCALFFFGFILLVGEPDEDLGLSLVIAIKAFAGLLLYFWYKITIKVFNIK